MGRSIASRPKTKRGCITCRVRKVKCDEGKPHCLRCTSTGRTCDGYESLFRHAKNADIFARTKASSQSIVLQSGICNFSKGRVEALSANLSAKPPAEGAIGFEMEAMIVLEASLASPAVRSALICQETLRSYLRRHGHITALQAKNKKAFSSCIDLYNKALADLSGHIATSDYQTIHAALCCCLLFISIDVMQQDYLSSIKHFASGFKILRACRGRPTFTNGRFEPAKYSNLPAVDIFVLKLFTVPCPFAKQMIEDGQRLLEYEAHKYSNPISLEYSQIKLYETASQTVELVLKVMHARTEAEANSCVEERDRIIGNIHGLDASLIRLLSHQDLAPIRQLVVGFQLLYFSVIATTLSSVLAPCEQTSPAPDHSLTRLVSVADSLRNTAEKLMPDDFIRWD